MKPDAKVHLQPGDGRSSNQVLPFFNVATPGGGVVLAVGWSGEWAADFSCDPRGVTFKAGMARTHLLLHPGESIRTPRMLLVFYEQDRWRGQNLLRQVILSHYRPKRNGQPLVAPITWGTWGGSLCDVHLDNIRKIIQHDLPIDYYWMDAEWYGQAPLVEQASAIGRCARTSSRTDSSRFAMRVRPSGRQLMLWFEPERVFKGTPWHKEHRDWLMDIGDDNCLLNLGNPAARKFLTDFISAKIEEFGLGCYRQDFNMSPLPYWQAPTRRSARDRGDPLHRGPVRLLGRAARAPSPPDHRQLRQRRPADRPGDHRPQHALLADRRAARRRGPPVPHLRPDGLGAAECHEPGPGRERLRVPQQHFERPVRELVPLGRRPDEEASGRLSLCLGQAGAGPVPDTAAVLLRRLLSLTRLQSGSTAWMAWQFDRPTWGKGWCRRSAATRATTRRSA